MNKTNIKTMKRVTVTCPHCHKELAFNGQRLEERKTELQNEYTRLSARIRQQKTKGGYYRELVRMQAEVQAAIVDIKSQIKAANNITEKEVYEAFKQKIFQRLGKEETIRILKECEEELIGSFDTVTRYTRFENAGTPTTGKRFS